MAMSTIYVNRNGSPKQGARVVLSFSTGGVTGVVHTDRDGKAAIIHQASGTASVIVDGVNRGTMRAPASLSVDV